MVLSQVGHADVDWTLIKHIDLPAQPLDIAPSEDGKLIFILVQGEILVYSISEDKVSSRIPVDKDIDRVTYSERNKALILSGGSSKTLKMIRVDEIYNIDISGLPVKGSPDAPVTITVFDDYQ
jgi:hypothetical protein